MTNIYNPLSSSLSKHLIGREDKTKKGQINKELGDKLPRFRFISDLNLTFTNRDKSYPTALLPNTYHLNKIKLRNESGDYNSDLLFIKELKDQFKFNPALSLSFAITLFSMAGI